MIRLVDDVIELDGIPVARLLPGLQLSLRDKLEEVSDVLDALDQLKKTRARRAESSPYELIDLSEADQATTIDAYADAIATALACNDKLSLRDIDDTAERIRRKIDERARSLMFPGDNQICTGTQFGVVDVDGIRTRFRAIGAPPAEDLPLTRGMIMEWRRNARMDWVRRMPDAWRAEPLIAIRDPATGTPVVVDGSHRMIRLWLDGDRVARAYILSPRAYSQFLFATEEEFKAKCFQGETISKARLRVIFAPDAEDCEARPATLAPEERAPARTGS